MNNGERWESGRVPFFLLWQEATSIVYHSS